ncbi:type II secretion system F family protein [Syntrophomonas palmitatica]|uniref:type II secretion system F family protein n=1 Tax=Syntrophomonas palmitatica TaxID=402877 RepID=UPI0006D15E51|nr:type II secretion system F family protein [Syntrophomonas palmitatica]
MIDSVAVASMMMGAAIALPVISKKAPKINREEILCRTGLRVITEEEKSLVALQLTRAGINKPPEYLHGLKVCLASGYLLGMSFIGLIFSISPLLMLFLLAAGTPLMWFLPGMRLKQKIAARQAEAGNRLDDFTTYLSTALSSAPDILTALQEAGEATGGVYKEEIDKVLKENASGKNLSDALFDWGVRMDVREINTLISTLNQIYIQGAKASEKMKEFAAQVRISKQNKMMEAAGKLNIRLIFVVTFFMLIPLLMAVGYPAVHAVLSAF